MSTINTNYKANTTSTAGTGSTAELLANVQEALREIEEFKAQYADILSEENWAELGRLEVTLKAESAAMGASGMAGSDYIGADEVDSSWYDRPDSLQEGWNGIPDNFRENNSADAAKLDDEEKYGTYQETVTIPNTGSQENPNVIGFQMSEDMVEVKAESKGRDIVLTVGYDYDGDGEVDERKSWIIKDGSVRTEPFIISAQGLSHGVTIDCSRVIRVNDGSYDGYGNGIATGIYIHGSDGDDIIRGSQANDVIIGWGGDDNIDGQAGNDKIWGDEYTTAAGQSDTTLGGNDTINGGAGRDTILAGGGSDTVFTSDRGESVNEAESTIDNIDGEPPAASGWFNGGDDWAVEGSEDGMVVITNQTGRAGEIDIDMPDGYNMAYAEVDADGSLIITFVGDDGTFKVKIEDFMSESFYGETMDDRIPKLNFYGSDDSDIIDFSRVEITSQVINIDSGDSDDIILGARNKMLSEGVDLDHLTESQRNPGLGQYADDAAFAYSDEVKDEYGDGGGYQAKVNDEGQIEITAADGASSADDRASTLNICAPDGYETGYITTDGDDIYVILVARGDDGRAKTIVYKIDGNLGLDYSMIQVQHATTRTEGDVTVPDFSNPITLTPVSMDADDYLLNGGAGSDLIFTQKRGRTDGDPEDDIVEGEISYDTEAVDVPESATTTSTNELEEEPEEEVEDEEETE